MSYRDQFTEKEWLSFQMSSIWVFVIVAGIDGKIDKKEIKEFSKTIVSMSRISTGFTREVFKSFVGDINQYMDSPWTGKAAVEGLIKVSELSKQLKESEASNFKNSLVYLGKQIAEASGSIFKRRSDEETKAIVVIMKLLNLV